MLASLEDASCEDLLKALAWAVDHSLEYNLPNRKVWLARVYLLVARRYGLGVSGWGIPGEVWDGIPEEELNP